MELLNDMNYFIEFNEEKFKSEVLKGIDRMDRVKIKEISEEAGVSNALLIEKAKELGYGVKVASSTVTVEQAGILVNYAITGIKPKLFKKAEAPNKKNQVDSTTEDMWKSDIVEDFWQLAENKLKENPNKKNQKGSITINPKKKKIEVIHKEQYWLIPSNPEEFDAISEFKKGKVWWNHKLKKMKVNDIVYIYISQPVQKISIKTKIIDIDEDKKIFCLKLIEFLTSDKLSYINLLNNGFKNIQSRSEIKDFRLLEYIKNNESLRHSKKREVNNELKQRFSDKKIEYNFNYKNILLKGVPGTGKSRLIDTIIKRDLNLKNDYESNVLRINIHSASSNADLMQGIAINSNDDGNIEYKEKQGLILELIEKATFNPNQPFVLVLEEIQENSLNELIGDLIYLIEDSKRADGYKADNKEYSYMELIDNIFKQSIENIHSIKLPSLISQDKKSKKMIIPHNLFIFCTSNYRDDRKVIEDNLLRRFEVIEIYPKYKDEIKEFDNQEVSDFLKDLNESIVKVLKSNGEIHPDRFMIGHSIWLKVKDRKDFLRAFLKVITEFKDVKEMHFDDFNKILKELEFPFKVKNEYKSYEEWIKFLQNECYDFLREVTLDSIW